MRSHPMTADVDPLTSSTPSATHAPAIRTMRGRGCGRRSRSRTSRRRGSSRSGRSRSTPTSSRSPSSRCGSRARRGSRCGQPVWRSRRRRWSSCSIRRGTDRCAGSRTGASRRVRCEGDAPSIDRIAVEHPRRGRAAGRLGRARLRRAHRGAVPAWRDRVGPRRAEATTGTLLFRWTNEVIGKDDPEYRRSGRDAGRRPASGRAARCTPTSSA